MATDVNSNGNGNGSDLKSINSPWAAGVAIVKGGGNMVLSAIVLSACIYLGPILADVLRTMADTQKQQSLTLYRLTETIAAQEKVHERQTEILTQNHGLLERVIDCATKRKETGS